MATANDPAGITFRATTTPDTGRYEVLQAGRIIGTVGRFTMGAGQFGTTWLGTTPGGRRSTGFRTREAAAAWLLEQQDA